MIYFFYLLFLQYKSSYKLLWEERLNLEKDVS